MKKFKDSEITTLFSSLELTPCNFFSFSFAQVDSYQNLDITFTSTDSPVSLAVHSSNESDNRVSTKTTSLSHLDATKPRRSTHHRKHTNHQYSVSHSERENKPKVYATNEDYSEQQYQNYQQQQGDINIFISFLYIICYRFVFY